MIQAGVDEAGRGPLAGPVVSAAVILKLALTIYHDQLKDKYAVEEVIFHALKTIDDDWFDDNNIEEIMSDLYIGDKTIH